MESEKWLIEQKNDFLHDVIKSIVTRVNLLHNIKLSEDQLYSIMMNLNSIIDIRLTQEIIKYICTNDKTGTVFEKFNDKDKDYTKDLINELVDKEELINSIKFQTNLET